MKGCNCWPCRSRRGIAAIAPTLAAAYQLEMSLRPKRQQARRDLLQAERLVAHRELQLARAGATRRAARDRRYMADRYRKLTAAQRVVERARRRLEALA